MSVALRTGANRIDLWVRGERFATYRYGESASGLSDLFAAGYRAVTRGGETDGLSLGVCHGSVSGVAFGLFDAPETDGGAAGTIARIVSEEIMGRRGSQSVGLQQTCAWLNAEGRRLLTDRRTLRAFPGFGEGRVLDLTLDLIAPDDAPARLERNDAPFLWMRVASSLWPTGGGQLRNSRGEYDLEAIQGQGADWCACVGVVERETVGFALLDHPGNFGHPAPWIARADGLLSPAPFLAHALELAPCRRVTFRYRLHVYRGYVDAGWATARLAEFAREVAP